MTNTINFIKKIKEKLIVRVNSFAEK